MGIAWIKTSYLYFVNTIRVPDGVAGTVAAYNQSVTITAQLPPKGPTIPFPVFTLIPFTFHIPLPPYGFLDKYTHTFTIPDGLVEVDASYTTGATNGSSNGFTTQVGQNCGDVDIFLSAGTYQVPEEYFVGLPNVAYALVKIEWSGVFETTGAFENAAQWRFSHASYRAQGAGVTVPETQTIRPADISNPVKQECTGLSTVPYYKAGTPFPYVKVRAFNN